jgi:beta-N-acetylhexosaminidase
VTVRFGFASAVAALLTSCTSTQLPVAQQPQTSRPTSLASTAEGCTNAGVIRTWSLQRRAATVVVVPVLNFNVGGAAAELRDGAGGLLFLGNAPAPSNLGARLSSVHALVMADEEGGGIQRLAPLVSNLPWPRQMAATMTSAQVQMLATRSGRQMRAAGVTVDLAPVLDVDARPGPSARNPDGARSFSGDATTAARYGIAFMRGLRAAGVTPVVKHFPGLGGSVGNTDVTSATTTAQLGPFRSAISAGAPAVMVANAAVKGVTSLPATLSRAVMTTMLRGQLGFHGLVVTDSLSAGAVQIVVPSLAEAVVRSLTAGADLTLFGSTLTVSSTQRLAPAAVRQTFDQIVTAVATAVHSGRLAGSRLDAAVGAVLAAQHVDLCH